ncbi:MAG: diphosphate--fructose-6-phosphate 1-phosphotransferase [Clostridia bacterium]|nr:diphosphate--fructose-6-phosphate 1-phosphotransferase [Clostridia bacterium]
MKSNILFMHGGGPTAVINCSLWGVISEAGHYCELEHLYAAIGGTGGFLREQLADLRDVSEDELARLCSSPGSAIGTSRDALDGEDYERLAALAEKYSIKYIVMNGGNGTMDACGKLYAVCRKRGINVIGLPKTMDNDLMVTDHTPGYGSAARYVAASVAEVAADVVSMPRHIVIIEVSGRDAGWLAASAALASINGNAGADLIYVPERPFSEDVFLEDVARLIDAKRAGVVVVSEGLRGMDGEPLVKPVRVTGRSVSYGNIAGYLSKLVADKLGYKARGEKPGLLGRASIAWQSGVDREEAILAGREAVRAVMAGESGKMVTFERVSDRPYQIKTGLVDLRKVMLYARTLPAEFINERGNYPTAEFVAYLKPLIGDPLPKFVTFRDKVLARV